MEELRPCILTVDVGTSSLKAVVYGCHGTLLASASRRYPISPSPQQPGWAEANPQDWWEALLAVVQELKHSLPDFSQIQAVALTGQMHTAVLLDEDGQVLPPTMLWLDRRAAAETAELQRVFNLPPYHLNSTYSLPRLVWLARHFPQVLQKTRHLLWPKDYLRYRLTGEFLTDFTEAGGAALLDWEKLDWAVERLEWAGISPVILPPLRQPTDLAGPLLPEIADQFGLDPQVKVLVGAGDVLALATGAPPAPGRLTCSMGSSSMVFYPLALGQECRDPQERIYSYPLLPYRLLGGVSSTSGASINWAAGALFGELPFEDAIAAALTSSPGANGLLFLPFLSGERSPYWSDSLRGSFYGLTLNHNRQDMLRAVLEGVAFSLRALIDLFQQTGVDVQEIALAGGGAAVNGLPTILANICQRPLVIFSSQETVTHGLYAYACQVLEGNISFEQAIQRTFKQPERIEPDVRQAELYDHLYHQYSQLANFADQTLSKL
ncbi:MAG: FGGY family carbohydrate kinase [Anaerolineaceae bacterium]|nr:FGGY family carbohydrate kinase [Anaerolineaceae bacterium]